MCAADRLGELPAPANQAVRWRTTAHTMIATTSEALKRQGGSGAPADLVAAGDAGEAREAAHEWIRWIGRAVDDVTAKRVREEWTAYTETLPADLREMASQHPVQQAELTATEFAVRALLSPPHRKTRSRPPAANRADRRGSSDKKRGYQSG